MFILVNVDRLNPKVTYGKLGNFTEIHVAPFKSLADKMDEVHSMSTQQLMDRIPRRSATTNNMATANDIAIHLMVFPKNQQRQMLCQHYTSPIIMGRLLFKS